MSDDCQTVELDLVEHVYGELPAERADAVDRHLAACPTCRSRRDDFAGVRGALALLDDAPIAAPAVPRRGHPALRAAAVACVAALVGFGAGRATTPAPSNPALAGRLASLHGRLDPDARQLVRQAEVALTGDGPAGRALAELHAAERCLAQGDLQRALALATTVARRAGDLGAAGQALLARARLADARRAADEGRYEDAARGLAQLLDGEQRHWLAAAEAATGDALLERLRAHAPHRWQSLQIARRLDQGGDRATALKLLHQYPTTPAAREAFERLAATTLDGGARERIEAVRRQTRLLQELSRYQAIAERDPALAPYAHWLAGQLLEETGHPATALHAFNVAADTDGQIATLARASAERHKRRLFGEVVGRARKILEMQQELRRLTERRRRTH